MYVGAGRYVYEDVWALMLMKSDSRFIRDMADVMWDKTVLRQRCLKKTQGSPLSDDVKPLTPHKYNLVKGKGIIYF